MKLVAITFIFLFFFVSGCKIESPDIEKTAKPVGIEVVNKEKKVSYIRSIGTVSSKDIKKYGFKVPGKIASIPVKKGDKIKKGMLLAKLETKQLEFALNAAENTYKKAYDYFVETENYFNKIKSLKESGAVPATDYDKAKLAKDAAESDLNNAKVDVDYKKSMLSDASMVSGIDGYVIEILNKKGEIVPAGYPVIIVRTESYIVNTGVPAKELPLIKRGTEALIDINDRSFKGKVANIAQIPDEKSRAYNVEVEIFEKPQDVELLMGSVAKVDFITGQIEGIWIPVFSILTDGTDYVFTDIEGTALRKNIKTLSISGEYVLVEGLNDKDRVVVKGMKEITDGDRIKEQ
jgi:RND family efflux transporter MFP subunit